MIIRLLELFWCKHRNISFPQTPKRATNRAAQLTGTYIVCLNCGKEFSYDWEKMELINEESLNHFKKSYRRRTECRSGHTRVV